MSNHDEMADLLHAVADGMDPTVVANMTEAERNEFQQFMDHGGVPDNAIRSSNINPPTTTAALQDNSSVPIPQASSSQPRRTIDREANTYQLRKMIYDNFETKIICQNTNGPCPLIAIGNVMLLRDKLRFVDGMTTTTDELMIQLSDMIFNNQATSPEHEQDLATILEILPKLPFGLDINIGFHGVRDFEFTASLTIFDILNIHLFHGWLPDPEDTETLFALEGLGYNQAVEFVAMCEDETRQFSSPMEALQTLNRGEVISRFLNHNSSQLTYYGLMELHANIKHGQLAILFRNNHFHVITKRNEKLFTLVTDVGFANSSITWELLANVEGDSQFYDAFFNLKTAAESLSRQESVLESDLQLAMQLQANENMEYQRQEQQQQSQQQQQQQQQLELQRQYQLQQQQDLQRQQQKEQQDRQRHLQQQQQQPMQRQAGSIRQEQPPQQAQTQQPQAQPQQPPPGYSEEDTSDDARRKSKKSCVIA